MKLKKTALALIVAVSILTGTVIGVSGAGTFQKITAELRSDFTVKYNGQEQILKDANGERVYPITYNNSTYVPFRALGNMLGLDVGWDANTKTVMYDTPAKPAEPEKPASKGFDLIDKCVRTDGYDYTVVQSKNNKKVRIGDDAVDHWIRFCKSSWYHYQLNLFSPQYVTYNLSGEFDTLSLKAYSSYDMIVTVYNNATEDSVLGTFKVVGGAVPSGHTIPVNKAFQIKISATFDKYADGNPTEDDYLYLYDAYLT